MRCEKLSNQSKAVKGDIFEQQEICEQKQETIIESVAFKYIHTHIRNNASFPFKKSKKGT